MEDCKPIPILIGCTASGKTNALIELSSKYPLEVISSDSRAVFRFMNIGTAKPTPEELKILPHHLIDIITPDEVFSAGDFAENAERLISEIIERGRFPIISGGTALYIFALLGMIDPMPSRSDELRDSFYVLHRAHPGILYSMLELLDPVRADEISENDIIRQIRALEIQILSGEPSSELRSGWKVPDTPGFRIVEIAIPAEVHRMRIHARSLQMIEDGLIDEVVDLRSRGYGAESILGRTIGYKEVIDFLDSGRHDHTALAESVSANTWKLVRRQKNMFSRIRTSYKWNGECIDALDALLFSKEMRNIL